MRIRTRYVVLSLVVCTIAAWLVIPYLRPKALPKPIVVVSAFGEKVHLKGVKRLPSGELELSLTGDHKPGHLPICFGEAYLVCNNRLTYSTGAEWRPAYDGNPTSVKAEFPSFPGVKTVDVMQEVKVDRPQNHPTIVFKNIKPSDIPVTKKIGAVSVTIAKLVINGNAQPYGPAAGLQSTDPKIGILVKTDSKTTCSRISMVSVSDGNGRAYAYPKETTEPCDMQKDCVETVPPVPPANEYERLLALFSPKAAYRLRTKRTNNAIPHCEGYLHCGEYQIFPPMYPAPESLNIKVDCELPTCKKDIKVVLFRNVAVRP